MKRHSPDVTLSAAKGTRRRSGSFASLRMTWLLGLLLTGGCEFYHYGSRRPTGSGTSFPGSIT